MYCRIKGPVLSGFLDQKNSANPRLFSRAIVVGPTVGLLQADRGEVGLLFPPNPNFGHWTGTWPVVGGGSNRSLNTPPGGRTDTGVYSPPGYWKNVVGGSDGTYVPVGLVGGTLGKYLGGDSDDGGGDGVVGNSCTGGNGGGDVVGNSCTGGGSGGPYRGDGPYDDGCGGGNGTSYGGRYVVMTVGVSPWPTETGGHPDGGNTLSSSQPRP